MSSWVLGNYNQGNIHIDYEWDKYAPHYVVFVGEKHNDGLVYTLWTRRYATIEQAKRAYQRQVRRVKKLCM